MTYACDNSAAHITLRVFLLSKELCHIKINFSSRLRRMGSFSDKNSSYLNSSNRNNDLGQSLLFWVFLVLDIPAILCSFFVLCYLLSERSSRQALQNHAIIVILLFNLIYQVIDIPLHLQYFRTGLVHPMISTVCLFWWFMDYGFFFINLVLLMWSSFERHIIIFHTWMLATPRKRLAIHYLPISMIVILMLVFYGVATFAPPCQNEFNFTEDLCGMAGCYGSIPFFRLIERIGLAILPMFLIVIFSVGLLMRVVRQKYRVRRVVEWRKQRKLALHLISVSSMYLCFDGPLTMVTLVRLSGHPKWAHDRYPVFFYISYFPILLLPMVCIGSLPGLRHKINCFDPRRSQRIASTVIYR